jgi:hypothetical protein
MQPLPYPLFHTSCSPFYLAVNNMLMLSWAIYVCSVLCPQLSEEAASHCSRLNRCLLQHYKTAVKMHDTVMKDGSRKSSQVETLPSNYHIKHDPSANILDYMTSRETSIVGSPSYLSVYLSIVSDIFMATIYHDG